jgi:FkbM family methyltransferase
MGWRPASEASNLPRVSAGSDCLNIGQRLRSYLSPDTKARLRRSAFVRKLLSLRYGGIRSRPFPHGPFQLWFDGDRNLNLAVSDNDDSERQEIDFVRELLAKHSPNCAWDVGANIGYWTLFFASLNPPLHEIVAFEPDVTNRKLLQMNIDRNHLTNVAVRACGLSDHVGTATFHVDGVTGSTGSLEAGHDFIGKHYGAQRQAVEVEISTIDDEIARGRRAPQFIKIDVESHELSVLKGAQRTLAKIRPAIIVEVSANHDAVAAIFRANRYRMVDPATGLEIGTPAWSTVALPE